MFIAATIVHVFVLGSYLSTELSELWAAPGKGHNQGNSLSYQSLKKNYPSLTFKI